MGKIKNWDKKRSGSADMRWVNYHPTETSSFGKPISRGTVEVQKNKGEWYVLITRSVFEGGDFQKQNNLAPRKFDTKEKARKNAVKWMRNHPQG